MSDVPRGRGAGINKPAWMVEKERDEASAAAAASAVKVEDNNIKAEDNNNNNNNIKQEDNPNIKQEGGGDNGKYDDAPEGGGGSRNSKERDQFGREREGGGGGGGRSNDDRGRGGSSRDHNDDRGRDRDHGRKRDYDDRRDNRSRDYDRRDDRRRGGGGGGGRNRSRRGGNNGAIYFNSYEEEREWLEERRHKRRERKSKFDIEPTAEQLAEDEARAALESVHTLGRAGTSVNATGANMGLNSAGQRPGRAVAAALQPQQTRHARRIYIGNVPDLSEEDVHNFFRDAIRNSIILDPSTNPNYESHRKQYVDNDPIISVYINRERRFAFLEFKTMEITTACLKLDGIDIMGQGKVKVKRPNDYNAALAPIQNAETACQLDTAKLGIVSTTVPDGPNKIFIGGVPYHLTESQVLELLGAFGIVKAFHLVKQDANAVTSKGYCFVEYSDPNVTELATMGLNGMDMGGGKVLSCKLAAQQYAQQQGALELGGGAFNAPVAAPPVQQSVVDGVDVNALLSAAMGSGGLPGGVNPAMVHQGVMPVQQMQMGQMPGMMVPHQPMMQAQQQQPTVLDPLAVANAAASALDAAFGSGGGGGAVQQQTMITPGMPAQQQTVAAPTSTSSTLTRILVLLNMVEAEDLATAENHKMLEEEVREEVSKYGKLLSMKIPRPQDGYASSAIMKIFLQYETTNDAMRAEKELKGRAFGPNVVDAMYFQEDDYARGNLS